jgi:hypothetical protein
MNTYLILQNIRQALWNGKKIIIIGTLTTGVLTYLLTSPVFIKPLYESSLRLYPSLFISTATLDRNEPRTGTLRDVREYIEFLESNAIQDSFSARFDLVNRYKIDTTHAQWELRLKRKISNRVNVGRTLHNSIEIAVRDKDPGIASEMTGYLRLATDNLRRYSFRENYLQAYESAKKDYYDQKADLKKLSDSVENMRLRKYDEDLNIKRTQYQQTLANVERLHNRIDELRNQYGIYDLGEQINLLYEQLVDAKAEFLRDSSWYALLQRKDNVPDTTMIRVESRYLSSSWTFNGLQGALRNLTRANKEYSRLLNQLRLSEEMLARDQKAYYERLRDFDRQALDFEMHSLNKYFAGEWGVLENLRKRYSQAKNNYQQQLTSSYLVSPPRAEFRPVYPRRKLTAGILGLFAFVLTSTYSILRYKNE